MRTTMSDDLKTDIVGMLYETVIPGDKASDKAWRKRCEMIADQVVDRCMLSAYRAGLNTESSSLVKEIDRLAYELEAAKALVDLSKLPDAVKVLAQDIERLTAENVWFVATLGALIEHVNKRELDEVVQICKLVERKLGGGEGEGRAVH